MLDRRGVVARSWAQSPLPRAALPRSSPRIHSAVQNQTRLCGCSQNGVVHTTAINLGRKNSLAHTTTYRRRTYVQCEPVAGERAGRMGANFDAEGDEKTSRCSRGFSDRRPSNRPRAKPPKAASAGRLNHKSTACQSAVKREAREGLRGGKPEMAALPRDKRPRPVSRPLLAPQLRFETVAFGSPACINLPSSNKRPRAVHRPASVCPSAHKRP